MAIMACTLPLLLLLILLSSLAPISQAARDLTTTYPSAVPIKAVNLGGWLVTEGWIKPSLFAGIPINKDLLDGTKIQLKSVVQNSFLSAENGGGSAIVANRSLASAWETFNLWRITEKLFQFRVFNWQFIGLDEKAHLVAMATSSHDSDSSHTFEIVRKYDDPSRIRIRAPNRSFLQAKSDEFVTLMSGCFVTADYPDNTTWGDDDPSVFVLTEVSQLRGEFQVTNGYGHAKASSVMKEHWNTFIVEDDFKFLSENGLSAVRIPVGWWIRFDENPPHPFVGGSLQALDNAFCWAEKYNVKVILDLHAAPGSQNGWEHSGTRDGLQSWAQTDDTIDQSVATIDFLASRYSRRSSLYGVELINEPLAPGVTLDRLKKYYKMGYSAVRKYTNVHVIMSNRLSISNPMELIQFASGFFGVVIDVHYYNLFSRMFEGMSVQQNINYVENNRSATIGSLMVANGPLIFIGEWTDEWDVSNATKEDYKSFGQVQLNVYGRATFGWCYWTLKNVDQHWSLEWMIKNGYIKV
ncbi:hypothetical protein AXF42_Ash016470 [Apostasia shenzhenica]|uniref:Uncharacterized protein n=1 Tax=Apostasia shenzhenica TaxID=1088818 RepID=A0A2I0AV85_9ASPA|nr:hypothetical protein AXF42_Ash016470 [Apostasia shenzhenica]